MREILFRGKDKYNGKWVEGYYTKGFRVPDGSLEDVIYIFSEDENGRRKFDYAIVTPETVGQFTGLTDKNGKKIFEGDIVNERPTFNTIGFRGFVQWDDLTATYRLIFPENPNYYASLGSYSRSYTVIGNTYDNPELLKGGADNA